MTKRTILLRIDFLSELPEGVGSVIQDALQLGSQAGRHRSPLGRPLARSQQSTESGLGFW